MHKLVCRVFWYQKEFFACICLFDDVIRLCKFFHATLTRYFFSYPSDLTAIAQSFFFGKKCKWNHLANNSAWVLYLIAPFQFKSWMNVKPWRIKTQEIELFIDIENNMLFYFKVGNQIFAITFDVNSIISYGQ